MIYADKLNLVADSLVKCNPIRQCVRTCVARAKNVLPWNYVMQQVTITFTFQINIATFENILPRAVSASFRKNSFKKLQNSFVKLRSEKCK